MKYSEFIHGDNIIKVGVKSKLDFISVLFGCIVSIIFIFIGLTCSLLLIFGNNGIVGEIARSIGVVQHDAVFFIPLGCASALFSVLILVDYFIENVVLTEKNIYIIKWHKIFKYAIEEVEKVNIGNRKFCTLVIFLKNGDKHSIGFMEDENAFYIRDRCVLFRENLND